jgi:succinoglycan biosynthesis protein ExoM
MRVTIVVPTYRRQGLLQLLLIDLCLQIAEVVELGPGNAIEVVVVDNCPDRSSEATVVAHPGVRYVSEPRTGVANARNAGVRAGLGDFILFIDDDERPQPGWLRAFLREIDKGVDACFGPVEPEYEKVPPRDLERSLDGVFRRRLSAQTGDDVSHLRAYLGSGNSLFRKAICLDDPEPFDPRFNGGGEDVWLLRRLVENKGVHLRWCADAVVRELVPADRMTLDFLRRRRFRNGQLRCIVETDASPPVAVARVALWMVVGALQFTCYGAMALAGIRRAEALVRAEAGRGKMIWWRRPR